MAHHEIGKEADLPFHAPGDLTKELDEALEASDRRFPHKRENLCGGVLRGDSKELAGVVEENLLEKLRIRQKEIVAEPGTDEDLLHPRGPPDRPKESQVRGPIGEISTPFGEETGAAGTPLRGLTIRSVHLRGGPPHIANHAFPAGVLGHGGHFPKDSLQGAGDDPLPLVAKDGTEGTPASATPMGRHGEKAHPQSLGDVGKGGVVAAVGFRIPPVQLLPPLLDRRSTEYPPIPDRLNRCFPLLGGTLRLLGQP